MGRKSLKEPRQKEIIEAFYKLAKKEGLENASIAKTANEIDINPSLVMHYFKTKEHLVYGLVEYILDKYLMIFNVPERIKNDEKKVLLQVIDNIFSRKWDTLFDDSVSYSCYALVFRNKTIKEKYKALLNELRKKLEQLIVNGKDKNILFVENPAYTADLIFVLVDGAYYYLSLTTNKREHAEKLNHYKKNAISLLGFKA